MAGPGWRVIEKVKEAIARARSGDGGGARRGEDPPPTNEQKQTAQAQEYLDRHRLREGEEAKIQEGERAAQQEIEDELKREATRAHRGAVEEAKESEYYKGLAQTQEQLQKIPPHVKYIQWETDGRKERITVEEAMRRVVGAKTAHIQEAGKSAAEQLYPQLQEIRASPEYRQAISVKAMEKVNEKMSGEKIPALNIQERKKERKIVQVIQEATPLTDLPARQRIGIQISEGIIGPIQKISPEKGPAKQLEQVQDVQAMVKGVSLGVLLPHTTIDTPGQAGIYTAWTLIGTEIAAKTGSIIAAPIISRISHRFPRTGKFFGKFMEQEIKIEKALKEDKTAHTFYARGIETEAVQIGKERFVVGRILGKWKPGTAKIDTKTVEAFFQKEATTIRYGSLGAGEQGTWKVFIERGKPSVTYRQISMYSPGAPQLPQSAFEAKKMLEPLYFTGKEVATTSKGLSVEFSTTAYARGTKDIISLVSPSRRIGSAAELGVLGQFQPKTNIVKDVLTRFSALSGQTPTSTSIFITSPSTIGKSVSFYSPSVAFSTGVPSRFMGGGPLISTISQPAQLQKEIALITQMRTTGFREVDIVRQVWSPGRYPVAVAIPRTVQEPRTMSITSQRARQDSAMAQISAIAQIQKPKTRQEIAQKTQVRQISQTRVFLVQKPDIKQRVVQIQRQIPITQKIITTRPVLRTRTIFSIPRIRQVPRFGFGPTGASSDTRRVIRRASGRGRIARKQERKDFLVASTPETKVPIKPEMTAGRSRRKEFIREAKKEGIFFKFAPTKINKTKGRRII